MNNNMLIGLVRRTGGFKGYKPSLNYEKVLEAMSKVDRQEFIPDQPVMLAGLDMDLIGRLESSVSMLEQGFTQPEIYLGILQIIKNIIDTGKPLLLSAKAMAYSDVVVPIGEGQTTSQPSLVATMIDMLELSEGMSVLEIGTGCGYSAAVTYMILGQTGKMTTVEINETLGRLACSNLERVFGNIQGRGSLEFVSADGSVGLKESAPYDRIVLTAGVSYTFDPEILARQLKPEGGILLFPQQDSKIISPAQDGGLMKKVYQEGHCVDTKFYPGVSFVPLQGINL